MFLSAVTIGEIQTGIEITRERDEAKAGELETWLGQVVAGYGVLPMDAAAFRECLAGDLTFLRRAGAGTGGAAAIPADLRFLVALGLPLAADFFLGVEAARVIGEDYTIRAGQSVRVVQWGEQRPATGRSSVSTWWPSWGPHPSQP